MAKNSDYAKHFISEQRPPFQNVHVFGYLNSIERYISNLSVTLIHIQIKTTPITFE